MKKAIHTRADEIIEEAYYNGYIMDYLDAIEQAEREWNDRYSF